MVSLKRLSICYARTGARTHLTKAHIESIKGVDQLMSLNSVYGTNVAETLFNCVKTPDKSRLI